MKQSYLKSILRYDPRTGKFIWLRTLSSKRIAGQIAGSLQRGYIVIGINRKLYLAHRLAWFYMHGKWPKKFIDHINRIPSDNRISNLREANKSQNNANSCGKKIRKHKLPKGVKFFPQCPKHPYAASVTCKGIPYHLGYFSTPEEARNAYLIKAKELFGEFSS